MTRFLSVFKIICVSLLLAPLASACDGQNIDTNSVVPENIFLAVSNLYRTPEDRARDAGRKPAEVLAFYGVTEGMNVYEVGAGSGYYTDLLSLIVGQNGRVFAQYSKSSWNNSKAGFSKRFSSRGNVVPYIGEREKLKLPDNSVDMVMVSLIWHHMQYEDNSEELPQQTKVFLENTMRLLKPGGVLAIVEHEAVQGSSRATAAGWHRSPRQMTIDDVSAAGFEFAGASEVLANAEDSLANYWRVEFEERDVSQRFVLKFTKPMASN
ncbi:MAG: methyltransferase domain-containing protein [Sphingomonadales bacterium]|jgi:predicted methyltransferase